MPRSMAVRKAITAQTSSGREGAGHAGISDILTPSWTIRCISSGRQSATASAIWAGGEPSKRWTHRHLLRGGHGTCSRRCHNGGAQFDQRGVGQILRHLGCRRGAQFDRGVKGGVQDPVRDRPMTVLCRDVVEAQQHDGRPGQGAGCPYGGQDGGDDALSAHAGTSRRDRARAARATPANR